MIKRVLISIWHEADFPIQKNSNFDTFLLRSANNALLRYQEGITDSFLFIICGQKEVPAYSDTITSYGFFDFDIIFIDSHNEHNEEIDWSDLLNDWISLEITEWLRKKHPAAIPDLSGGIYSSLDFWWIGFETKYDECCGIDVEKYADILPDTHKAKASTWLEILQKALKLDDQNDLIEENNFAVYAATLCEWLHEFEEVSGNDTKLFETDVVIDALGIDHFYLGYIFSQFSPTISIEELAYDLEDCFHSNLGIAAFEQIIVQKSLDVQKALLKLFGGPTALLCALHKTIWPKFNDSHINICNDLVNSCSLSNIGELSDMWEFINR